MSDRRADRELEEFLKRSPALELEQVEPPRELDHIVLTRAREALEEDADTPADVPPYRTLRWAIPFGLTATLVITIALVTVLKATHAPAQFTAADLTARRPQPARSAPAQPPRDKAEWLAAIRALRAAGKVREADAQWAAFVAAYPETGAALKAADKAQAGAPPR